jgi:hypothetical protein
MLHRYDTYSVSINRKPTEVYDFIADLKNWPLFSDFAKNLEFTDGQWIAHTEQGDVEIIPHFNKELLLLDSTCIVASGEEQFIPYRVVKNGEGSELIMTNYQGKTSSNEDYRQQLRWMNDELENVKQLLENDSFKT